MEKLHNNILQQNANKNPGKENSSKMKL